MKRVSCLGVMSVMSVLMALAGCQDPQKGKPDPNGMSVRPAAAEFIIDNGDPGFHAVGTWQSASGGHDFKEELVWADSAGDPAKATWTPDIKAAGTYAVYEWHGDDPNSDHATNAPFTITYDGGAATVPVDLRANPGKWNLLGTYKFAAGKGGNVTLTNKANGNVVADAVKFVPQK